MASALPTAAPIFAARTEKGLRDENQDAMTDFQSPFGDVCLIADGMGGVRGGAEASLITAESFRRCLTSFPFDLPIAEALRRAASATNAEIRRHSQSGGHSVTGMGSTVVLAIFPEPDNGLRATIAHIGDSRAYLFREGVLRLLTRDHSAVQRLVDSKRITPEEARNHPDANVITRALGPYEEVEIEISEECFQPCDILMLCSDGLCGYVEDAAIAAELAQQRDLGQTADALIELALRSGSTDNVTVQLRRVRSLEIPQNGSGSSVVSTQLRRVPRLPARQVSKYANLAFSLSPVKRCFGSFLAGLLLGTVLTALGFWLHLRWKPAAEPPAEHESSGYPTPTTTANSASVNRPTSATHGGAARTSAPK